MQRVLTSFGRPEASVTIGEVNRLLDTLVATKGQEKEDALGTLLNVTTKRVREAALPADGGWQMLTHAHPDLWEVRCAHARVQAADSALPALSGGCNLIVLSSAACSTLNPKP